MPAVPPLNDPHLKLWYGARKQSLQETLQGSTSTTGQGDTRNGMRIAIQGEPGSFSHEAAIKLVTDALIVPFLSRQMLSRPW